MNPRSSQPDCLFCERCDDSRLLPITAWRCPTCLGPLSWRAPTRFSVSDLDRSTPVIWRYRAALPPVEPRITFGEEPTPLTSLELDGATIGAKLESNHPTASFKDRGCALLVNAFAEAGVAQLVEDSSGNAAASLAGYAARAGIPCTIYAPAHASSGKLIQATAYGATVVRVEGSRADVASAAEQAHDPERGVIYASHNWHPWFIAGVSTIGFELWEQLGHNAPEALIAPAGSGSIILGAFTAFSMLRAAGEIGRMPRIYAAQPAACSPLVSALERDAIDVETFPHQPTLAEGASIAKPVRGREVLAALRASGGGAVALSESEIAAATRLAASQGLFIEPTSALAVAAAERLVESGRVPASTGTVMVLTGSGLKSQAAIETIVSSTLQSNGKR
jgi:threonine synthase